VTNGAEPGADGAEADGAEAEAGQPLRVSTLELFFDLVFVFTVTQLTGALARDLTVGGVGDDERAEDAMTRADSAARPRLALQAYFYAYIPILLGIVALAAGVKRVIGHAGSTFPYPACLALGGGVALYLAGDAAFRGALRIGTQRYRAGAAVAAVAASAVGVTFSVTAEIALLGVIVVAALVVDRREADTVEP
jgi:low temperature requirement protein LtrA